MFTRFQRILIALASALLFAGITLAVASAQDTTPPPAQTDKKNCAECHTDFQMMWENGMHGNATKDPVFVEEWNAQGNPSACLSCHVTGYDEKTGTWIADGVTCAVCHTDTGGDHPNTAMAINNTPTACGTCHTDTRFGWQAWEGSTHYKNGMDCTNCHDPHSASLKLAGTGDDASQICTYCHKDVSEKNHGIHADKGVTCVDCHITQKDTSLPAHTVPDHSFKATLAKCTACHAEQIHASGDAVPPAETQPAGAADAHAATPAVNQASLMSTPAPVSPLGYAGLAALIGIAAGMLLSPWLERLYSAALKKSEEVRHDDDGE